MSHRILIAITVLLGLFSQGAALAGTPEISTPPVALNGIGFSVEISGAEEYSDLVLVAEDQRYPVSLSEGAGTVEKVQLTARPGHLSLQTATGAELAGTDMPVIPSWFSLLPSFIAIFVALTFRQVIPALFAGLWSGAALTYGLSLKGVWFGFFDSFSDYAIGALTDQGHISIITFSLLIGGLVGIISKNGGMVGLVEIVAKIAHTRRRGQLSTALLGTAIFFDDYANTMVVGNAMRPITDRLKISREKLAYIVDSTAAPVASLALVTTWIGFQVGLIDQARSVTPGLEENAYSIFLHSIPFGFYSILAVFFVYLVVLTGRDFGPMRKAEARCLGGASDDIEIDVAFVDAAPFPKARFALIPLAVLIVGTFVGIYVTGVSADARSFQDIIGNGDPYVSMIWASATAVTTAILMSVLGKRLDLSDTMEAFVEGMKTLMFAVIVLTLAWSLAEVNGAIQTSSFLSSALAENLSPALLPLLIFIVSALMAFATGTSWGVMGIVMPLVIPLAWSVIGASEDAGGHMYVLYGCVASVLSGAVWGDHCSPISDTTILSSMASQCDHIEHVRTQLPYAAVVALAGLILGVLPAGFGISPWACLVVSALVLWGFLRVFGGKH